MACPKCKTIVVTKVEQERGQNRARKVAEQFCRDCGVKHEVTGHGKARTEKAMHVCNQCGSTRADAAKLEHPVGVRGKRGSSWR